MAKLRTVPPVYESIPEVEHPEHQVVNTRVSHYMRLYATGKIAEFPTTSRAQTPELPEGLRKDLLNRNMPLPEVGTNPVEVLGYLASKREEYEAMVKDYNLAIVDKQRYDAAMEVINQKDPDPEELRKAIAIIEAIKEKARARYV